MTQSPILNAPIKPTLIRSTIPVIWGTLLLLGFGLVDTFFVSMLGDRPLAAISFTFPVTFTVISLNIGIGIGAAATVARLVGAGKKEDSKTYGYTAILLGILITVTAVAIIAWFSRFIFFSIGVEDDLWPLVQAYIQPWFLAGVLLSIPMVCNSVLRANGDTNSPSKIMALGGMINVILDPFLIFGVGSFEGLGISGAAWATVVAWLVCSVVALYYVANRRQLVSASHCRWREVFTASRKILSIAAPAAVANMLTPLANGVLMAIVASYGYQAVAAWGVGGRIESIMTVVLLSLSMSLPPMISQNFGAGKMERVNEAFIFAVKFILGFQIVVYGIGLLLSPLISDAFTDDSSVAALIDLYLWIVPLGFGAQGAVILTNSTFNALHKPMMAMLLNVIRLFVLVVPCAFAGSYLLGVAGMFWGVVVAYIMASIVSIICFRRQVSYLP